MLLDLLEDPHEIRCICVMGRNCTVQRGSNDLDCSVPLEKKIAEGNILVYVFFLSLSPPQVLLDTPWLLLFSRKYISIAKWF